MIMIHTVKSRYKNLNYLPDLQEFVGNKKFQKQFFLDCASLADESKQCLPGNCAIRPAAPKRANVSTKNKGILAQFLCI